MKKIKVLQVVGSLHIGGAETVAMNLYRYIDRNIFEFHYLVYGSSVGFYEKEVKQLGGKVIHIDYSYKKLGKYKKDLINVFNEYGPYDIIHAHMMFHNSIVLSIAKKYGIPITVSHAHSTNDGGVSNNPLIRIIRVIYIERARKIINENSDFLIACGEDAGKFLYGENEYKKRGYLLKNGIDIKKYKFNVSVRNRMQSMYNLKDKIVFGCVGHFEKVKNHQFLIDVFQQVHKNNSDTILVLLGDGKLKEEIQNKCTRIGLENSVIFTGNVNNVNEWMQSMDYLLMPSLYEGIPVTLIEAQASGLKCYVSDHVSTEPNITGLLRYLPLNQKIWTDELSQCTSYNRSTDYTDIMKENGYDVENNVIGLEYKYYELLDLKGIKVK